MTVEAELRRENERLQERLSKFTEAILRINTSLDLNTVLNDVVEIARELTGAHWCFISAFDENEQPLDFVFAGVTPEMQQQLHDWSSSWQLFEHLRDLPAPIRVANLRDYVRRLGMTDSPIPEVAVQGMSMRHRGAHVGIFYLCHEEDGRTFTEEDEKTMVLLGAQAAAAIANARAFREEQQARADLKALIDMSPVGVAVINAVTGKPMMYNREVARIGAKLIEPGQTPDDLLEVFTCRRGDGREYLLSELPLADVLADPDTVRAEEILLTVPQGRQLRALVNATPIPSADGRVTSLMVTLQDLASIEETERRRAEFVSLVGQELRAPLSSIKGSVAALLDVSPGLDSSEIREYSRIIDQQADHMRRLINDLLEIGRIESGTLAVSPRQVELPSLVNQAKETFLGSGSMHAVPVELPSDLPPVIAEPLLIVQVLARLMTSLSQHAQTASTIRIAARLDGIQVAVSVTGEECRLPQERLLHLFRKYTSNGKTAAGIGGGLSLAICKGLIEAHGGRIWVESDETGQGIRFTFTLPTAKVAGGAVSPAANRTAASENDTADSPILIVDEDPQTLGFIRDSLTGAGFRTVVTGDHGEVDGLIRAESPRLVVIDLALSASDGIESMRTVSEVTGAPIIFLSANESDDTIGMALKAGGEDYIVKPFTVNELITRVNVVLHKHSDSKSISLGDLAIDVDRRRVFLKKRLLQLTATEFELLRVLALNIGRVVTYEALIRQVWRGRSNGGPRLVRTYIKRLRQKLGREPGSSIYIVNERGIGYRIGHPE